MTIYEHIHTHTYMHQHTNIHSTHTMYTYMSYTCARMHAHIHIRKYTYIHIYTYIYNTYYTIGIVYSNITPTIKYTKPDGKNNEIIHASKIGWENEIKVQCN